jgi:peptidyl-prolyl cis-trans isomerase C
MSKYLITIPLAAALLTLSACDQVDPGRPASPEGDVVAVVNKIEITQPEVDGLMNARRMNGQPVSAENTLQELIGLELLRQEAIAKGILQDPEIAAEINRQVANVIVSKHVNNILTESPITDEVIAAEYAKQIEARPDKEYKSSHILVKTEEEGKAVIKQLDGGAKFEDVAKEKSIGPSGKSGGSLGWSSPSNYVPEFGLALQSTPVGTYSKQPVKTQFGWHVILVEEIRDIKNPPLEQIKPQLQRMLMAQRISEYVENLRENANITIVEEKEEPAPAEEKAAEEIEAVAEEAPAEEESPEEAPVEESPATE